MFTLLKSAIKKQKPINKNKQDESTKVHKPRHRQNACRQRKGGWVGNERVRSRVDLVQRAPGEQVSRCRVSYMMMYPQEVAFEALPLVVCTKGPMYKKLVDTFAPSLLSYRVSQTRPSAQQKKVVFFAITFDPNAFSEIHESKTF